MIKYLKKSGLLSFILFLLITFYSCETDTSDPAVHFPATRVMSLYIDESGIVWAGTDAGIISSFNGKWQTYKDIEKIPAGIVNDIAFRNSAGGPEIWMATLNGLCSARCNTNSIISATSYTKAISGLLDDRIKSVLVDAYDAVWLATPPGLNIYIGTRWYAETSWGDLAINPVTALGAGSDGWIFAGTKGQGVGRFKYDESIDGITGASYYNTDWSGLPSDTVLSVYIDGNDNQWFGTPYGVAFHTDWETKIGWEVYSAVDGLVNNRVQAIIEGKNGLMWFGTADGISSFDGEIWKSYNVSDGLANQCVNDIAVASDGTIWFATDNGISTFDGTTWESYSRE